MTIVIAARQGETALLLADTMIDTPGEKRNQPIPGRMKIIIIDRHFTVAYASEQAEVAHDVIVATGRSIRNRNYDDALNSLVEHTRCGKTDFIVAYHKDQRLFLKRLKNGVALDISHIEAIGDTDRFNNEIERHRTKAPSTDFLKSDLRNAFFGRLQQHEGLGSTIGGFPISVGAEPDGHQYLRHMGFYWFEFPPLLPGKTYIQSEEDFKSGTDSYQINIFPSSISFAPVVGVFIIQAKKGWIYAPLECDVPRAVNLNESGPPIKNNDELFEAFKNQLDERARLWSISNSARDDKTS